MLVSHHACTVQRPYGDRVVTGPSPCTHQKRTTTIQGPDKDRSRTVSPDHHCAVTVLSPNHARTEPRPYCDRAMTVTALGPCRNWTVQGPCKDRSNTVLSPFFHRAVHSLNVKRPCFYRNLYAIFRSVHFFTSVSQSSYE